MTPGAFRPTLRWLWRTALLAAVVLTTTPTAAAADAAGPTNYRAEVTPIEPAVDGVAAEIYGGDAFIRVTVEPGRELLVAGYEDDPLAAPYLRIDAQGDVFVNRRSPAAYLNAERYGSRDVDVPDGLDPEAPPAWEQVASGGTYAWHDHRIHWMSPSLPPQVDGDADAVQPVFDWEVPIAVDGEPARITGTLVWQPSRNPLLPLLVALVVLGATALLVRSRHSRALPLVGAAGLLALGLGLSEMLAAPPGAEADPLRTWLPALGLAALLGAVASSSRGHRTALVLTVLAGVPLVVWVLLQLGVLTAPVLVGAAPDVLVRYGVAAVLGTALGVLVVGGLGLVEPLPPPAD